MATEFGEILGKMLEGTFERHLRESKDFRSLVARFAQQTLNQIRVIETETGESTPDPDRADPDAGGRSQNGSSQNGHHQNGSGQNGNGHPLNGHGEQGHQPTPGPAYGRVPLRIGDVELAVPVTGRPEELRAAAASAREGGGEGAEGDYVERTARARSIDLGEMAEKCELKAAGCCHQIVRNGLAHGSAEELASRERMHDLIAQAKAKDSCFLWMFFRDKPPTGDEDLRRIAECYRALACAARVCQAVSPPGQWPQREEADEALQLLATASSALRVALRATWLTQPDHDQDDAHRWLKLVTAEQRFLVRQHMQLEDPADPVADAPRVIERGGQMLGQFEQRHERTRQAEQALKKALYHARRIREAADSPYDDEVSEHDCAQVNAAVELLDSIDPPQRERMVREIAGLAPPELFAPGAEAVRTLRDAAAALRPRPSAEADASAADSNGAGSNGTGPNGTDQPAQPARQWSEEVATVRQWLEGRRLVVVGGERRPDHVQRMADAFGAAVEWVELTEHGRAEPMRAPIGREDTALVVVLIKLTGHEHADKAREFARDAGVPFVLLPAGYNPERIAHEVLAQVSERLAAG